MMGNIRRPFRSGRFFIWVLFLLGCNLLAETPSAATQPALTENVAAIPTSAVVSETPSGSAVNGRLLYVANNGSDDNDGSQSAPLLTIQEAVDNANPGDTIEIETGTYAGARIERSGTADAWITLTAVPGATVLINTPGSNNKHDSNLEIETWEGTEIVSYWIIDGLEVANAPNWGIDMRGNSSDHSHHLIIRNNKVHDNGTGSGKTGIFTAFVDDIVVEGNESYANGEHGIYLSNSGDRFTVRGNRLHNNMNCGLHMNGDASQGGDGIISDGIVEANTIYNNGLGGCAGINMDGVTDTIVRNNLLYDNHASGIAIFQQDGAVCSHDNRVLNNTILNESDGRWAITISHTSCVNNKLFNNILYTAHSFRGSIEMPDDTIAGFESDYNIVMNRFSIDDGNSVISLGEWQALGYDAHSLIINFSQLFVNMGADDYHLIADSQAIDSGVTLPDVPTDLDGRPRPAGAAFDIGAYEYSLLSPAGFLPVVVKGNGP
ncbi:MAG: right-handed parallel beta-helix repeat-containing protein [Candidatus Promineifilaceae bacterium]